MADSEKLEFLIEMGFDAELSKRALISSNNSVEEAMEWVLVHGSEANSGAASASSAQPQAQPQSQPTLKLNTDSVAITSPQQALSTEQQPEAANNAQENGDGETAAAGQANSLKCDECGKLLRDADAATAHAYRTKHSSFSESVESIKPRTPEEIEEQKRLLNEKLVRLRQERQERERQETIEREKSRRVQGRQIGEIRQKVQEDEMKRLAEEKRREKLAVEAQRQRVKDQIAKDRAAFKLKQEGGTAAAATATQPPAASVVLNEKRSYDECKIQVRLTDGKTMVQTFKAKEQLAAVRLWIQINRTDGHDNFALLQTFPRKQFTDDEMMQSLESLGLVPASSLVVTRCT